MGCGASTAASAAAPARAPNAGTGSKPVSNGHAHAQAGLGAGTKQAATAAARHAAAQPLPDLDALLKAAEQGGGAVGGANAASALEQLEALEGEAGGLVDRMAGALSSWAPTAPTDVAVEVVEIQSLTFEGRSVAESKFLAYSALGRVVVKGAGAALQALPFGAPLGALLGGVYAQAERTARTSANVARLLARIKSLDAQLSEVVTAAASHPKALERAMQAPLRSKLRSLGRLVARAGRLLGAYCGKGFLRRMLTAGGDQEQFEDVDRTLTETMLDFVTALNMSELATRIKAAASTSDGPSPGTGAYIDEGRALADALCTAVGDAAGGDPSRALDLLAQHDPDRLRDLACAHLAKGPLGLQLVGAGLRELGVRVEALEKEVGFVKDAIVVVQGRVDALQGVFEGTLAELRELQRDLATRPPAELAKTLADWWQRNRWRLKPAVTCAEFVGALMTSLQADGYGELLKEYDEQLAAEGLDTSTLILSFPSQPQQQQSPPPPQTQQQPATGSSSSGMANGNGKGNGSTSIPVFLQLVARMADDNDDDKVSQNELLALQLKGDKFAKVLDVQSPRDWPSLLDVVFMGFDRKWLLGAAADSKRTVASSTVAAAGSTGQPGGSTAHTAASTPPCDDRSSGAHSSSPHSSSSPAASSAIPPSPSSLLVEASAAQEGGAGGGAASEAVYGPSAVPSPSGSVGVNAAATAALQAALQVQDVISSYNVNDLLEVYVAGTRGWLYNDVTDWLQSAVSPSHTLQSTNGMPSAAAAGAACTPSAAAAAQTGSGTGSGSGSGSAAPDGRMFLLLAGPGMGKSVFSAVVYNNLTARTHADTFVLARHFFKVGQPRAQGRAMLLSLAVQLAARLPGLSQLLLPVAQEHGTGAAGLALDDVFSRFLLEPLSQLDATAKASGTLLPPVLLLLDALDESDHGGLGWLPVAQLVATQFARLPSCVKVIVTSRPHTSVVFSAWGRPHVIEPQAAQNLEDMRLLLAARLKGSAHVAQGDVAQAVELLQAKSEGQLIYAKYALEFLSFKRSAWTVPELSACLPQGLYGAYELSMRVLTSRLARERPELVPLLQHTLLPVLVAMREPLSTQQVAWACGVWPAAWPSDHPAATATTAATAATARSSSAAVQEGDVLLLLDLLSNLFPRRLAHGSGSSGSYTGSSGSYTGSSGSHTGSSGSSGPHQHSTAHAQQGAVTGAGMEVEQVHPYHKSVLDWLTDGVAGEFRVDVLAGHTLLAERCVSYCLASVSAGTRHPWLRSPHPSSPTTSNPAETHATLRSHSQTSGPVSGAGHGAAVVVSTSLEGLGSSCATVIWELNNYALQQHMAHIAAAPKATAVLAVRVLRGYGLIEAVFRHGVGHAFVRDLGSHARHPAATDTARDGHRWLQFFRHKLLQDPTSVLTTALCSPIQTPTFRLAEQVASSQSPPHKQWRTLGAIEWNQWPALLETLEGHAGAVTSVAFSADDAATLASSADDTTVRVWDTATAQCTAVLQGHSGAVYSVALSSDGSKLATASADKTVRVWDMTTMQCSATLQGHSGAVYCVAFSQDGTKLASGSLDQTVQVWDLTSGHCSATLQGHTGAVRSVAFNRDGTQLASAADDQKIQLWEVGKARRVATLQGHSGAITSVAYSPDGTTLASGSRDKTIRLWDTGASVRQSSTTPPTATLQGHSGWVTCVAFSPDGGQLASASRDKSVRVWQVATGICSATLHGHFFHVTSVAFSPDGARLASGGDDKSVRLWDAAAAQRTGTRTEAHTGWIYSVAFSPDGRQMASASDDQTVRVWDAATLQCVATLRGHTGWVFSATFNPADGTKLASASDDSTVKLWDAASGLCTATLQGHSDLVFGVAFDPAGVRLASASKDTTVKIWDTVTARCLATLAGHTSWVRSVAFSPDGGQVVSGSRDGSVRLWSVATGQCVAMLQGHSDGIYSVACSPDGRRLVSASDDHTVRVWDVAAAQCTATLTGHTGAATSVVFSPDGTRIASGSRDNTVRVWDVASAACTAVLLGHLDWVAGVAFSRDGSKLASASRDKTLRVWDSRQA